MDESPALALRSKKDSSMRVAVDLVKSGEAHACVSAGNTGALMAISRFVLKMLPGIDRPAIISALPNAHGAAPTFSTSAPTSIAAPEHLLQFGIMGATLVSAVEHKERPSVGLLNIGEEDIKGNEVVKKAAELLRASGLNFIGNIEGDDIYKGDGRRGGVRRLRRQRRCSRRPRASCRWCASFIREEFMRSPLHQARERGRRCRCCTRSAARLDPRRFNGATLLGLSGIVVKSHGSADALGFAARDRARGRGGQERACCSRLMQRFGSAAPRGRGGRRARDLLAHRRHRQLSAARTIVTNDDLAKRLDTSRRMDTRAHRDPAAPHRRAVAGLERPRRRSEPRGARMRRGVAAKDIDLIIVATATPDYVFPSTACIMQAKLGAKGCAAFDMQAVCSGFVYALAIADKLIRSGSTAARWSSGARCISRILDWNDRGTCVLFGDGAGAVVLKADCEAGHPGQRAARRRLATRASSRCRATSAAARSSGRPSCRWTGRRCSSSR